MNVLDIIAEKRDGNKLNREKIHYLVNGYTKDSIPDYQISSFLMAAFLNGFDTDETFWMTEAMLNSGGIISFPQSSHPVYDKHSSGGVGDKITLVLTPLMTSLGYNIAMLCGRSLGHTGGTLDKLESIPGVNPFWSKTEIKGRLRKCGMAVSGQTPEIAPADRKIYALRDLTGTVESIPFIAASILSKKLALKTDGIVFDIKVGSGAFMKTRKNALKLAKVILSVCRKFKHPAVCLLTDMSEPLGYHVGNFLEIMEAVEFLKTGKPDDIKKITYALAWQIAGLNNKKTNRNTFYARLDNSISSGKALESFETLIKISGGNSAVVNNTKKYFKPRFKGILAVPQRGYIHSSNTEIIGKASLELGAGRLKIEDKIDPMAGIILTRKIGQFIDKGEPLFKLYGSTRSRIKNAETMLSGAVKIGKEKIAPRRKIITLLAE